MKKARVWGENMENDEDGARGERGQRVRIRIISRTRNEDKDDV